MKVRKKLKKKKRTGRIKLRKQVEVSDFFSQIIELHEQTLTVHGKERQDRRGETNVCLQHINYNFLPTVRC